MAEKRAELPVWIATCAWTGYFPIAPGTAGAAVGAALAGILAQLPLSRGQRTAAIAGVAAILFALGVWAAGHAEKFFGRRDPGQVVIDEVVGQMVAFLGRPAFRWRWLALGFVLFRLFDILKPFPARRAERLAGGWGIMLDDLLAGGYSLAALTVVGFMLR